MPSENDLWLQLLRDDCDIRNETLDYLLAGTDELIAILVTMAKRTKAGS